MEQVPQPFHGTARDQAGAAVGVSGVLVDRARTVRNNGVPELIAAVEEGRMSVNAAAEVADLPQDVQRDEAKAAVVTVETVLMAEASWVPVPCVGRRRGQLFRPSD